MDMIKLFIVVALTILVSTGYGIVLNKKIEFKLDDFVTPIGFALLITLLQLSYYPAMLFNFSSTYEHITSLIIYVVGLWPAFKNYQLVLKEYLNKKIIYIAIAFVLFLVVFYQCYIDIAFSDAQMYLNYMSQNINIDQINMFDLWTGEYGEEWDTIYLFQGYYHFGSFISWLTNAGYYLFGKGVFLENITIQTWGLGMIYSVMSSMLLVNFANYFKTNKILKIFITAFGLFYLNFFYWRVALAFYGNTFRTLYMCALIYFLFRYFKEERKDFKIICIIISFAGMAFSSSYLFICFSIMYALMTYIFHTKEKGSIAEMADFVLPLLLYALACFYKDNWALFVIGGISASLYFIFRNKEFLQKPITLIEKFLHKNSIKIFVIIVPLIAIVGGAIYYFGFNPNYEFDYAHYFQNHSNYDMIKDFFFIHSGESQNLVNIVRWVGVALILLVKPKDEGMKFLKYLFIVMFVFFLNPLCTVAISKLIASNVYYRSFDVVFNPFTEMLFLVLITNKFDKKFVKVGISVFVVYMIFYCHVVSHANHYSGEYGFYLNRNVVPKYKMTYENYDILRAFKEDVQRHKDNDLRVISHAEGLRTFVPEAYQLFTARQIYYPWDRIDQEFFEQSRNHYPFETYEYDYYANVCEHIDNFGVDYIIVEWFHNWDYDIEVSKCGVLIHENEVFKLYKYD